MLYVYHFIDSPYIYIKHGESQKFFHYVHATKNKFVFVIIVFTFFMSLKMVAIN